MPRDVHRKGTVLLSVSLILIGIAIMVRTIEAGGSATSVGILLGAVFLLAGAIRLWLTLRSAD